MCLVLLSTLQKLHQPLNRGSCNPGTCPCRNNLHLYRNKMYYGYRLAGQAPASQAACMPITYSCPGSRQAKYPFMSSTTARSSMAGAVHVKAVSSCWQAPSCAIEAVIRCQLPSLQSTEGSAAGCRPLQHHQVLSAGMTSDLLQSVETPCARDCSAAVRLSTAA